MGVGRVQAFRYGGMDHLATVDHDTCEVRLFAEDEVTVTAVVPFDDVPGLCDALDDAVQRRIGSDRRLITEERVGDVVVSVHAGVAHRRDGGSYLHYKYRVGEKGSWVDRVTVRELIDSLDTYVTLAGERGREVAQEASATELRLVGGE